MKGAFSRIKCIFREYVTARKFVNMAKEMAMKASVYNEFMVVAWFRTREVKAISHRRFMQQSS